MNYFKSNLFYLIFLNKIEKKNANNCKIQHIISHGHSHTIIIVGQDGNCVSVLFNYFNFIQAFWGDTYSAVPESKP